MGDQLSKIWKDKKSGEVEEPPRDDEEQLTREEMLERYREEVRRKNREDVTSAAAKVVIEPKGKEEKDREAAIAKMLIARRLREKPKSEEELEEGAEKAVHKFSLKNLFSRFTKKKEVTEGDDGGVTKPKWSLPKMDTLPQMIGLIALVTVVLVVALRVGFINVLPPSLQPQVQGQEGAKPSFQPLSPLDVKSADWVAPIQQVLIVEAIAFYLLTVADARKRKQVSDAVAVTIALVVVFAPVIPWPSGNLGSLMKMFGFEGASSVVLGTVLVLWATFAGGRDFNPLGCYLGLIGMGGLLFGSLGEVSAMLRLDPTSSVLSVTQVTNLIVLKSADKVWLSVWIYILLGLSFIVLVTEVLRPAAMEQQGDKGPTIGSLFSMAVGVATYLVARLGIFQGPPVSFVIGLAGALTVGALTQNEKMPQFVPGSWSVRTMYDSATLMTSGLVLVHVLLGVA